MATYKLIQDIEAEDHILGPLTLREFIFGMIAAFLIYINVVLVLRHLTIFLILFLPPALFFTFFALPFGRDQPTEVWALAKLRYYFKPRKRVWNQSGVKELVTINAPKKEEPVLTKGFSQTEVKSRLRALADTIDSRGWAIKNVNISAYAPLSGGSTSDRLIDIETIPASVPEGDAAAYNDMLDENTNPLARQFDTMINRSTQAHRQQLLQHVDQLRHPVEAQPKKKAQAVGQQNDYWFMNTAELPEPIKPPEPALIDPLEEAALSAQLKTKAATKDVANEHLKTLKSLDEIPPAAPPAAAPIINNVPPPPPPSDPAIMSIVNNNDLSLETLGHEVGQIKRDEDAKSNLPPSAPPAKSSTNDEGQDEVIVPLH